LAAYFGGKVENTYKLNSGNAKLTSLTRGMGWGFIGGLTGTMVMDGLLMVAFLALKLPALSCFSIVGNTVSQLFSMLGLQVADGIQTGVIAHYLIGPLFGVLFGVIISKFPALGLASSKKTLLMAILYVEIFSQPILVTTPILLKMTMFETLQWYGGSFVMHLTMAVVLGAIMWYGILQTPLSTQRKIQHK
jgi:uncharacterized membrane protein YagU involved in acid resistance